MVKLLEIFWIFLKLGCTSFGGPAAHLVFFKQTFAKQRQWLTETQYDQLLALTQLLPGPSSSQMGIAIGYLRQNYWGAVVAWLGFSLPSVVLMSIFAFIIQQHDQIFSSAFFSTIQSLLLAIIIFAFWQMLKNYCKTKTQFGMMCLSTILLCTFAVSWLQFAIILATSLFAISMTYIQKSRLNLQNLVLENNTLNEFKISHRYSYVWLIILIVLFLILWLFNALSNSIFLQSIFSFYKTGSLVFGGGHVVLPMLQQDFVNTGLMNAQHFELGYTLTQLMPGPLFTFASYIGAFLPISDSVILNIIIATIAIFLPSFFLIFATLPYWSKLLKNLYIQNIVSYINAVVVGFILSIIIPMSQRTMGNMIDIITTFLMLLSLYFRVSIFLSVPILLSISLILKN